MMELKTQVKTETYLLYALQNLKTMQEDMEVLTTHDSKADPEVLEESLDEIIVRAMVPALQQLGVENPLEAIADPIDPSEIYESELDRITDELEGDEDEEFEE